MTNLKYPFATNFVLLLPVLIALILKSVQLKFTLLMPFSLKWPSLRSLTLGKLVHWMT